MDSYKHSVGACQSSREMNPQTNEQAFNILSSASFKSRAGGSGEAPKGISRGDAVPVTGGLRDKLLTPCAAAQTTKP